MKKALLAICSMVTTVLATENVYAEETEDTSIPSYKNCKNQTAECTQKGDVYYALSPLLDQNGQQVYTSEGREAQKVTIYGPPTSATGASVSTDDFTFGGTDVTTIDIKGNVTTIENSLYHGAKYLSNITTIMLPDTLTTIGYNSFQNMTGVTSLTIPNSVTSIGYRAFANLTGVTGELKIPDSLTIIDQQAFQGMSGITGELKIPSSVTSIAPLAFDGMTGITGELKIPNSVTTIGDRAFQSMVGVTSLIIPNSVTTIDFQAFGNMTGVTGELKIPDSVTSVGSRAFNGMRGLTSLIIPDGMSIGDRAFQGVSPSAIKANASQLESYLTTGGGAIKLNEDGKVNINCKDTGCQSVIDNWFKRTCGADKSAWSDAAKRLYNGLEVKEILNDGSAKIYKNGQFLGVKGKRIYTISEANDTVKEIGGNTFRISIRYK